MRENDNVDQCGLVKVTTKKKDGIYLSELNKTIRF